MLLWKNGTVSSVAYSSLPQQKTTSRGEEPRM